MFRPYLLNGENQLHKNMRIKKTKLKAFSLVELIVAMSIFFLVVSASTSVFVTVISARKKVKNVQINLEDARYALELMAKNIRMSTNVSLNSGVIYMLNNSQNKCVSYKFDSIQRTIKEDVFSFSAPAECSVAGNYLSYNPIVFGEVNSLKFDVVPSSASPSKKVGKVTVSVEITAGNDSNADTVKIQTTVSLRDYKTAEI